jgi:hypothetical protein
VLVELSFVSGNGNHHLVSSDSGRSPFDCVLMPLFEICTWILFWHRLDYIDVLQILR